MDTTELRSVVPIQPLSGGRKEFRLQTAAYAAGWAEQNDRRLADRWVIRLDKETGEFEATNSIASNYNIQGSKVGNNLGTISAEYHAKP